LGCAAIGLVCDDAICAENIHTKIDSGMNRIEAPFRYERNLFRGAFNNNYSGGGFTAVMF
jgi:hypothetical protein